MRKEVARQSDIATVNNRRRWALDGRVAKRLPERGRAELRLSLTHTCLYRHIIRCPRFFILGNLWMDSSAQQPDP